MPKLAEVIAGYWLKIGVKAELVPSDWAVFRPLLQAYKHPGLIGQAATMGYPPRPSLGDVLAMYVYGGPTRNYFVLGTEFPDLDRLIDNSLTETDPAKRREILAKAVKIVSDSYGCLMVAEVPGTVGLGSRVDIDLPKEALAVGLYLEIAKHRK